MLFWGRAATTASTTTTTAQTAALASVQQRRKHAAAAAAAAAAADDSSAQAPPAVFDSGASAAALLRRSRSKTRVMMLQQQQQQQQHRRSVSWGGDSLADLSLPRSPWENARHAAREAWLLAGLAAQLWTYLGLGWRWMAAFWRLALYAALLLPGFAQMIVFYFTSPRVRRGVPYGRKPRQRLDLYLPAAAAATAAGAAAATPASSCIDDAASATAMTAAGDDDDDDSPAAATPAAAAPGVSPSPLPAPPPAPAAVIFVTGGAWTIGFRAWGALLGRRLSARGVLVACLDYRNFPQGSASDMLEDVNAGVAWCLRRLPDRYGADPDRVWLVGQSAGGQLALLALLAQAAQAATGGAVWGGAPVWHPRALAGVVGVSGAYDLEGLAAHLHRRGLYRGLLDSVMSVGGAKACYALLSPLHAAHAAPAGAAAFVPPVLLLHGTADKSVPPASSLLLGDALRAAGCAGCRVRLLPGKTHTDLLIEDGFAGGRDALTEAVLGAVAGRHSCGGNCGGGGDGGSGAGCEAEDEQEEEEGGGVSYAPMVPRPLVRLASWVCPF